MRMRKKRLELLKCRTADLEREDHRFTNRTRLIYRFKEWNMREKNEKELLVMDNLNIVDYVDVRLRKCRNGKQ